MKYRIIVEGETKDQDQSKVEALAQAAGIAVNALEGSGVTSAGWTTRRDRKPKNVG